MEILLPMWVIYESPADAPGKFVVRRWAVDRGATEREPDALGIVAPTLELARRALPDGLTRMEPSLDDDPAICEVWI